LSIGIILIYKIFLKIKKEKTEAIFLLPF